MKFIKSIWIATCLLLLGMIGQSGFAAECVPQAEMQAIAQHFTQFRNLANKDYCYDGSHTSNLIQAFEFMRKTPYTISMPKSSDELFSGAFAKDWWGYFIGRISDIDIQASCPKGVGAFVYMFGNTMYVCPMLLTDNFAALDRVSVMMHEARHIDGFPHVTCSAGPRAGLNGACDKKMSDGGSYAVSVETYAQLGAFATDLHPALKAYARASAVIYADEAFQVPARIHRTQQFLLLTNSKEFYKLPSDGSLQVTRLGDAPALGHVVMRSRHMILFPDDRTLPAKFVFALNEGEIPQQAGDLAVEYNAQTPQQRAELVDMHIGGLWNARIFRDRVRFMCDPRSANSEDVALNGQVPVSAIYPNGYDRGAASAHLVLESGSVVELGCRSGRAFVRASALVLDQKYRRIQKMGNLVIGLRNDGRLFQINGNTSAALQTSVDGRVFDLIPNETYQFFDSPGNLEPFSS